MALFLDLSPGDRFRIAETTVTVESKGGGRTRLRFDGSDKVHQNIPPAAAPIQRAPKQDATPAEPARAGVRALATPGA